jgi:hypothetical protein
LAALPLVGLEVAVRAGELLLLLVNALHVLRQVALAGGPENENAPYFSYLQQVVYLEYY